MFRNGLLCFKAGKISVQKKITKKNILEVFVYYYSFVGIDNVFKLFIYFLDSVRIKFFGDSLLSKCAHSKYLCLFTRRTF